MNARTDLLGRQIGRFRIDRQIGSGGMGTVFEATDVFLGRPVALKVLTPLTEALDDARERFFREARAVARLEHPNIVRIYEADSSPENPYIAMELVRGGDVKQLLTSPDPPSRARLLELAAQVFDGLGHAHAHGVIHRDVKPANVLLTTDGTVKLIDFGLARLHDDDRDLTRGQVFGSASYMPPEQIMDPRSIDHRADIYSAGVLLHQLVTGKVPHQAATVAETLVKVVHGDVPDPRLLVADLDPSLAELILACLARNRDDRPASAAEVARTLRELAGAATTTWASSSRLPAPPLPVPPTPGPPVAIPAPDTASLDTDDIPTTWQAEEATGRQPSAPAVGMAPLPEPEPGGYDASGLGSFALTTYLDRGDVAPPTFLPPPASPRSRRMIAGAAGVGLGVLLAATASALFLRRPHPSPSSFQLPPLAAPGSSDGGTGPAPRGQEGSSIRLVAISPDPSRGLRLDARLGQAVEFRVRTEGTTRQPRWLLNDDPVAEGPSYVYRPLRTATRDLVSVSVGAEGSDRTAGLSWYVSVK